MTMKSFKYFTYIILLTWSFGTINVRAEAPVVDLGKAAQLGEGLEVDSDEPVVIKSSFHRDEPLDQRILRLERQITNLTEMNLATKLERIQEELQQLRGQLEVQGHELAQLKEQQRNFYQDLDKRINNLQPETNDGTKSEGKHTTNTSASREVKDNNQLLSSNDTNNQKELQAYETAFNLLNKKQYDKAVNAFQTFVKTYPKSNHAANAHYWLGEIFYLKGKSDLARKEFQVIVTNYPSNPKTADALLKLALVAMDTENYSKARQYLLKIQKQFPNTTAAKVASLRLKEIKDKL
jgi:tol-pal system protein YbgF